LAEVDPSSIIGKTIPVFLACEKSLLPLAAEGCKFLKLHFGNPNIKPGLAVAQC
jgi:hypothetical protein